MERINMEETVFKIAIMINNHNKVDVLDLGYYNEWEWDDFNTMRDNNGKLIIFDSRVEAISHIMKTFNDDIIDSRVIAESSFPEDVNFSGGIEMLFR